MGNKIFNGLLGASAFSPASVSNLYQWFKADAITGKNNNDTLSSWTDSSGNSRNASQGGGSSAEPVYKTNVVNGKPAVYFDGVAKFFNLGDLSALTAARVFLVFKLDADPPAAGKDGLWRMGSDDTNATRWPFAGDGNCYDQFGTTARKNSGNPSPSLDAWGYYSVKSGPSWTNFFNGTQHYTTAGNTVGFNTTCYLGRSYQSGSSFWLAGHIAEYILYSAEPAAADVTKINNYITAKYGL